MPLVVAENSTMAEPIRYRRPRNQSQPISDPNQIPSIIQSTRCKSTISSLLLSTFTPAANDASASASASAATPKKKNFAAGTLRGLGCAASPQVSVPAAIRASADWEAKKVRKKKQKQKSKKKGRDLGMANGSDPSSASAAVVVPDVCCGPGIGFAADAAASVDCVVSRRPGAGRVKVDGANMNQREQRSCPTRRMVNPEAISLLDSDHSFGMTGFDVFGSRYHRHVRHPSPEGLAEIMMFQSSLLMGGRSVGFDRYRDWRLDVDNMSYEELLELGDRIGYVNTGLKEDEIVHCLRKTKLFDNGFSQFATEMEWKCSICQEDYENDDEMGKLECGHFYHIHCIKQWLARKNTCPICKTAAASQK
ncbi:uncharacterized protein LOC127792775 [Diospyros lotus]|uniref:uncharacterized protein LOC127792775 n=1 Tax=Diospyros lotus TaxID=55363 RepID=UPI00224E0087|nr:uncharacterized protein LOC127792775 [Diospyros lotus]